RISIWLFRRPPNFLSASAIASAVNPRRMLNCTRRTRSISSAVNASPVWLPISPSDCHSRKRCMGSSVRSLGSSSRMAPPVPRCYASAASDSEVPLSGLEFLFIDVTAGIALAQNFERFVAWGQTPLADEPAQAEDECRDDDRPEHQHHEHHQEAASTPHEHHRVGAPVPFPRTILRKRHGRDQHHERERNPRTHQREVAHGGHHLAVHLRRPLGSPMQVGSSPSFDVPPSRSPQSRCSRKKASKSWSSRSLTALR